MTRWFSTLKEARAHIKKYGGTLVKGIYPYAVNPKQKGKRR